MTAADPSPPPAPTWSPETRTWVSLALFAHMFVIVIAMTAYTRPSLFQERIHDLFEPYLRNLHLTALPTSYPYARFHLGHASSTDVDFSIEVDANLADGSTETIVLPKTPLQPLIRWRRYQSLANATGTLASGDMGDSVTSILPKAIAGGILREHHADGGVIRVLALGLPADDNPPGLEGVAKAAKENVSNVYEAQVIVSPGSVELLRKTTTLETAPIESAPATSTRSAPAGANSADAVAPPKRLIPTPGEARP